jgi:hypothetical protein
MRSNRILSVVQAFVGVTAIGGGIALAAGPDGHYLMIPKSLLAGTPFTDYLVPGLLLAICVGGGGLLAASASWSRARQWQPLALLYAVGLIVFLAVELVMIGLNPLQGFEALLAFLMLALVGNSPRAPRPAPAASR